MSSAGGAKKNRRVSIAPKDVHDIQPVVYSFKGPPNSQVSGSVVSAVQPPQWLYHDHVMGVIWMIFHKEKNYVGISQLQWCLKFLLDLKNSQGEYTGDVEICIQAIQDDLIEQYANLGPALDRSTEEKSRIAEKKSTNVDTEASRSRANEPTTDEIVENAGILETSESHDPDHPDLAYAIDNNHNNRDENQDKNQDENQDEIFSTALSQGIAGTSTPNEEEPQTWRTKRKDDKRSEKSCGPRCKSKQDGKRKRGEVLSFTYDEMMARGPAPCTEPESLVEDTYSGKLIEYSAEKSTFGQLSDLHSSELMNFLNSSKRQHEETLRNLERLMGNMNVEGLPMNLVCVPPRRQENMQHEDVDAKTEETKTAAD